MQVTPLFATFFAFLSLVAPLATHALKITTPAHLTTLIVSSSEPSDSVESLNFFLSKNEKRNRSVPPSASTSATDIPAHISGTEWSTQTQTNNGTQIGQSLLFAVAVASSKPQSGMSNAGAIVGGVCAGVIAFALIILGAFLYRRRRHHQLAAVPPTFDLETGFQPHARSFSSTSASTSGADAVKARELEEEKAQWETTLEEQFARARAHTPDIPRGMTPLPRNESPMPLRSPPRSFRY